MVKNMTGQEIVDCLHAKPLVVFNHNLLNHHYEHVFACDLMSDVLAMVQNNFDTTILLTGLCNAQSLRTAEMLDLSMIVYVRGKKPSDDVLSLAKEMGFNIFYSDLTMFDASGCLYDKGMRSI